MTVIEIRSGRTSPGRTRLGEALIRALARLDTTLATWRRRRAYRQDLKRLSRVGPHMIADIGLTPETARREIETPFWRS